MAAFQKFFPFVEEIAKGTHNLNSNTLKVMLTNGAPSAANAIKSDITEITAKNGYSAGGNTAAFSTGVQTAGTYKLVLADPATWTADTSTDGTGIGPFRYAVLYNDSVASPVKPLIGWWDYGSSVTLASGEQFTVDLDQSGGVLTLA
jgi:hypothetical protein